MKKTFSLLLACLLLLALTAGCGTGKDPAASGKVETPKKFPVFETKDLNGNTVSSDIFAKNAVTVVNIWFIGCKACVDEMPDLEAISKSYEGKGVAFYSICTDLGETADAEDQAKRVLSDTGVTYPTLYPTAANTELGEFLMKIYAFPTTVLVNRNGEIIGNPIEGSINSDAGIKHLKDRIDKIVEADSKE